MLRRVVDHKGIIPSGSDSESLDGAGHVAAAAQRRLDLAVAIRALGDAHLCARIQHEDVIDEVGRAVTACGVH